jgi:REP element-mobilizing transposase RayT
MARAPRVNVGGAFFHVTCRGALGQTLFSSREEFMTFLKMVAKAAARHRWLCHGYCLMGTHYHLVLETTEPTLSQGMHMLNLGYARWFNRHTGGRGHVFEARFYSGLIAREEHLFETVRYVAVNPVRAGLCAAAADWPWSSYPVLLGAAAPVPGIIDRRTTLGLLVARRARTRTLRDMVEAA